MSPEALATHHLRKAVYPGGYERGPWLCHVPALGGGVSLSGLSFPDNGGLIMVPTTHMVVMRIKVSKVVE